MAEQIGEDRMAVTLNNQSQTQSVKDTDVRIDDLRPGQSGQRVNSDNVPKKKSTFKITSVTKNTQRGGSGDMTADVDGDSMDDLDESHTEDLNSEVLDCSKATDNDPDSLMTPGVLTPEEVSKPDAQSRFRVVKIETKEPFRRGRWLCHDYLNTAPEKIESKSADEVHVHSNNSSASSSIHFVHGVDDPSKNPLTAGAVGTVGQSIQTPVVGDGAVAAGLYNAKPGESFIPIHPAMPLSSQSIPMSVTPVSLRQPVPDGHVPLQPPCQPINLPAPGGHVQVGNPPTHLPANVPGVCATHTATTQSLPQTVGGVPVPNSHTGARIHVHTTGNANTNVLPKTVSSSTGPVPGMAIPPVHAGNPNVMQNPPIDPIQSQHRPQNFQKTPDHSTPIPQVPQVGGIPIDGGADKYSSDKSQSQVGSNISGPSIGKGKPSHPGGVVGRPESIQLTKALQDSVGPLAAAVGGMSSPTKEVLQYERLVVIFGCFLFSLTSCGVSVHYNSLL